MRQLLPIVLLGLCLALAAAVDNGLGLYEIYLRIYPPCLLLVHMHPVCRAPTDDKKKSAPLSNVHVCDTCQLAANGLAQLVVNVWRCGPDKDAALIHEDG